VFLVGIIHGFRQPLLTDQPRSFSRFVPDREHMVNKLVCVQTNIGVF